MFKTLKEDIQTIFAKDPAAKNILEVILLFRNLTIYANMWGMLSIKEEAIYNKISIYM